MKFATNLSEFNLRFAKAVSDAFSDNTTAEQSPEGKLYFRGPNPRDRRICTHVAVCLEDDVLCALDLATPLQRELMIRRLIDNLATQIRTRYDPKDLGEFALRVVGTLKILGG